MTELEYLMKKKEFLILLSEFIDYEQKFSQELKERIHKIASAISPDGIFLYKTMEVIAQKWFFLQNSYIRIKRDDWNEKIDSFSSYISEIYETCQIEKLQQPSSRNSENYFQKRIANIRDKENKLTTELSKLQKEDTKHQKEIQEINNELSAVKKQKEQIEKEKEELTKKLDARNEMEKDISKAFSELKEHISPLKKEEKRLNRMFITYAIICIFVLITLGYFEYQYLENWNENDTNLIHFLRFYAPLPVLGGLLWASVFQMNRAQRQLMQVANTLYHIDYVEGLLYAINQVSTDVNTASDKIGRVLDMIIKNYVSTPDGLSEQSLDAEISKDNINLQTFINLAKEIKEVIK